MSNTVLIQQASGPMRLMLELTAARHADYCARHGICYWPVLGDVQRERSPHWNKITLIKHALAEGFERVVWLDADTLILRFDEDIRTAINGGPPLALAQHPVPDLDGNPTHFNSGVIIARNGARAREFFDAVWTAGPLWKHPWHEQGRVHDVLKRFPDMVQRLDDRWNSTVNVTDVPNPIIKAWHGSGTKALSSMYEELKRIGGLDAAAREAADQFVHADNVSEQTERAIAAIPPYPNTFAGRGIVTCGGGLGYFTCAWVCIHQLRRLDCRLPIELWYLGPHELDAHMRSMMEPLDVKCVDASEIRKTHPMRLLRGFELKAYSVLHSCFREVIFLDADNVPVANPELLFDAPEYGDAGAIFWPDYWRMPPEHLAWKLFGVPYRDEPEFESGQIVIDKARCWRALNLAMWFNENSDFFYHHVHGDKDTFRFAWHRLGQRFAMPPYPISSIESTMCQHDFQGCRLFQHRNSDKWNFRRDNKRVEGFLFEEECQNDVRNLRKLWDGKVFSSVSISKPQI
jgi:hypothetical protein